jgi:chitinase
LNPGGCADPGCEYASAGLAGPCSQSVGTLTNAELEPIIAAGTPKLYTDAAVKYITWDTNQWAAYDDEDTCKFERDF